MLNKIKVYNRKTGQIDNDIALVIIQDKPWLYFISKDRIEVPTTAIEFSKECYYITDVIPLVTTDPLGKFKEEMEGWWFCKKYVVVEHNTTVKCEYYNYIEKEYVIGDHRGKNQMEIDMQYSEILYDNGAYIPKYLKRWDLKEPVFNLGGGQFTVNELDKLQAEIDLKKAKWQEMLLTKVNPNYIAFQKFVNDLGMNVKHGTEYEFSYQSIGEDNYIKLLEIIK